MKKTLLLGIVVLVVGASVCFHLYREAHRPKRVWVAYSEKYQDADLMRKEDYEQDVNNKLFAEERLGWRIAGDSRCMVLTRDRQRADYIVSISVVRYINGGDTFGTASLSIAKRDGDIVLVDSFSQNFKSTEDIAQQPITKTWDVLCHKQPR